MGGINEGIVSSGQNTRDQLLALLRQDQWAEIEDFADFTQSVSGSGATSLGFRDLAVSTVTTSSSTALARSNANHGWNEGKARGVINWSKKIVIHFPYSVVVATTNGKARVTLGKATGDGEGDLVGKGIGIKVENLAIKGHIHNGTDAADIDLSTTLVALQVHMITIISDGAGNVEWLVDGVSKGTSSAGPTGDSVAAEDILQSEVANGADSADQQTQIYSMKVYVGQ